MKLSIPPITPAYRRKGAFTLVEVMVACGILALLLSMALSLTSVTSQLWKDTANKMQAFGEARQAMSQIGQKLNLAVLNPYWDYDSLPNPTAYERYSELQFLATRMEDLGSSFSAEYYPTCGVFFQTPGGITAEKTSYGNLPGLLNTYGYFIQFESDAADRPSFLPSIGAARHRYRYRLKEWLLPTEKFKLYSQSATAAGKAFLGAATLSWINFTNVAPRTLADNVIALVILPKTAASAAGTGTPMTDDYFYNSRTDRTSGLALAQKHQLPPEVEVVMVAIDEDSASRLQGSSETPPALVDAAWFRDSKNFEDDLRQLQTSLDAKKVRYMVLRSKVPIRAAQWSK